MPALDLVHKKKKITFKTSTDKDTLDANLNYLVMKNHTKAWYF